MLTYAFKAILPIAVLTINVVVACQVRRAATNAAANLGVQPHHQSTSSNSIVPTVMLIATSIIYVLIYSTLSIQIILFWWFTSVQMSYKVVVAGLIHLAFAYNFYVYLITGKQFRSELHKLFCCCLSSCSCSCSSSSCSSSSSAPPPPPPAVVVVADDNDNPEAETTF